MSSKIRVLLFLVLSVSGVKAQYHYTIDQSPTVEQNGRYIFMPWSGGFNSAQVNTLDVNQDNQKDIVVFDKSSGRVMTFLKAQTTFKYAPEYESLFPEGISSFVLLRDYNCDGKKDLFTFNEEENGVSLYKNTTAAGQSLSWSLVRSFIPVSKSYSNILLTKGFTSLINILPGVEDIPNITDIDGDGDLDILNMRFVNPGTVEFHKNFAMERYGKCDSLVFERQTQKWGNWQECGCGVVALNNAACPTSGGRTQHTGGKALLALDSDGDGDKDLLFTEEDCARIYLLPNTGTTDAPVMGSVSLYPATIPVGLLSFPAPFLEDVDFDGLQDLLVSPNLESRVSFGSDFAQSLWYYKNTGTQQRPQFSFVKRNFLQDEMIEVGDNSVPAFFDVDGDNDLDMFISNFNSPQLASRVYYYENVGDPASPAFRKAADDFASMSMLNLYNLKIQFADMDANGTTDMVFTGTGLNNGVTSLFFLPNSEPEKLAVNALDLVPANFTIGYTENVVATDINLDGAMDLLVGRASGALEYMQNTGGPGGLTYTSADESFLDLAADTQRQNLSLATGDLDADGFEELITGNQNGELTVYNNFRSTNPLPAGDTDLILDPMEGTYGSRNLGGKVWPFAANLFNTDRPAIVVGNTSGGVHILKNDDSNQLPDEPVIIVSPNPVLKGEEIAVKVDRNASLQIFSMVGQKMTEPVFLPANQSYPLSTQDLSSGLYIARVKVRGKNFGKLFMVR